jgi:predicted RND superfamily exporter protein
MKLSAAAGSVVRRPALTLVVALLVCAALAPVAARLRLDTDLVDLFPRGSAPAQAFARFSRSFVAERILLVLVEADDPARLTDFADRYAASLATAPGVAEVRYRLTAAAGAFLRQHLLQLLTEDELVALGARTTPAALKAQAARLRSILSAPGGSQAAPLLTADPLDLLPLISRRLSHGLPVDTLSGYFKSADGRALLLFVRPRTTAADVEADRALIADAAARARALGARITEGEFAGGAGPVVGFTGACAYTLYYRDWLHGDTSRSTTLSALVVLLLFGVFFRALRVLPLVATPLFAGLLATGAAAAALYGRVNAVSLSFGTILLSIGIDVPIQLYNRLREELGRAPPLVALELTMVDLAAPSVTATLAPAAVFFSCALSSYRGLAELGVLAGVGLICNLAAMLTVFPALLAVLPPRLWAGTPRAAAGAGALAALGRAAAARPRVVVALAGALALVAAPVALGVRFDRRLMAHPESMPPVRVESEVERRFGERDRAVIALVESEDPDAALASSDAWLAQAEALRQAGLLRSYQSISALLPSARTQAERRRKLAALDPPRLARQLRAALDEAGFDTDAFASFLAQLERPPPPLALADAREGELDFLVRSHVLDGGRRVATYLYPEPAREEEALARLGGAGLPGTLTGKPVLERALKQIAERDTLRVTAAATLLVALLLALYYRRARPFVAVMGPLALAWVLFGAGLALLRIPLNLFNLLAVPLVIGYGIDDHVYLVHRAERDPAAGPAALLATTGRAIVLTSLSTIAGFLPLAWARFPGLRLLGVSGALAVALCLVSALGVLPALLVLLQRDR